MVCHSLLLRHFSNCISSYALMELKYLGNNFTRWNARIEEDCIFKSLDRVFVNHEFMGLLHLMKYIIL